MSAWKTASLGEIFDIARGGSPRPIQDYITDDEDGVNWISISDASASDKFITETKKRIRPEGVSRSRMVKPGDFLLTNSMSFGRPYIMGTSGCIHDGWLVLSSKHGDVDQDYFFHLLGSDFIYAKFTKLAAGATVKNLNIDLVSGVDVNFPPLEEQRRIAAILDQAETIRTQRRQALAHLDTLTQSLFLDMFGDPRSNPRGWREAPVGALTDCIVPGRDKPKSFSGGIPWVTTASLIHMGTTFPLADALGLSQEEIDEVRAKVIPAGSVIISCVGDLGVVSLAGVPMVINQQLHSFQCGAELNNLFLMHALSFQKAFMLMKASSTTLPYMNKSVCNSIPVLVPPLARQQSFATRIQAIEALKATHRAALAQLDALFASLQQRAFAGKL